MEIESKKLNELDFQTIHDKDWFAFNANNLFMMDNLKELPTEFYNMRTKYVMTIFCNEGKFQLTMDEQIYMVNVSQCIICSPNAVLKDYMMSPDVNISIVGFSWKALEQSQQLYKYIWNAYDFIKRNPVVQLNDFDNQLMEAYYKLTLLEIQQPEAQFMNETQSLLFQAYIFEFLRIISRSMSLSPMEAENASVKQGELILRRFLDLLAKSDGKLRSVTEASAQLNLTPKYFSKVIKNTSGRSPIEWIHEYTMKAIVHRLRYSNLTIKEIAHDLDFPSLSFFGKFVKEHLGLSPTDYRISNQSSLH